MPADFEKCIRTPGSKKFTHTLSDGRYVHGCRLLGSDKAVWGEVHEKKGERLKKAIRG